MYKPNAFFGPSRTAPDRLCGQPYLAFALILATGLAGIEGEYELPEGAEDDVWSLTERERQALGISPLPRNLDEAIRICDGPSSLRPSENMSLTSSCGTSGGVRGTPPTGDTDGADPAPPSPLTPTCQLRGLTRRRQSCRALVRVGACVQRVEHSQLCTEGETA